MRKYKLYTIAAIIGLVVFIGFSAFKSSNQAANPYVLIDIYETPGYEMAGLHVHYPDGKTEFVEFKKLETHHHDDNGQIIVNKINELQAQGWNITHTAAGLGYRSGMITKIFMQKN